MGLCEELVWDGESVLHLVLPHFVRLRMPKVVRI
jgi:hypothetical protein